MLKQEELVLSAKSISNQPTPQIQKLSGCIRDVERENQNQFIPGIRGGK